MVVILVAVLVALLLVLLVLVLVLSALRAEDERGVTSAAPSALSAV